MYRRAFAMLAVALLSVSPEALAQSSDAGSQASAFKGLETFWVIFAAVLVFFM